jgi:hypothetical protein
MTWIVPFGVTIIAVIAFHSVAARFPRYPSYPDGLALVLCGSGSIIVSLAAWLVWAVVT